MYTFLEQLANYYTTKYLTEINDICFVFPGKRAGLFFGQHLSRKVSKPIWAPKITTIMDFFSELNPVPIADSISLIFRLHLTYQRVMSSDISIDEFIPLGEMILSDFNDIDKYRVHPGLLFSNLTAIKELEDDYTHLSDEQIEAIQSFWSSFDPAKLSQQQNFFLDQWKNMHQLYQTFRNELQFNNEAYEGMIYRSVAERVSQYNNIDIPYKKVVFAGFNALNECEKVVCNYLQKQKKAEFFWDYPKWILNTSDSEQHTEYEAARFIKHNLETFPPPDDWMDPFEETLPDITIAAASNELVQAQMAHSYLKIMATSDSNPGKTALILADEQQLLPVLYSIPTEYSAINITLGYSLKNTPAFALVENILAMQKTTRTTNEGKTWFYHRDVLALLRHQYMTTLMEGQNNTLINQLIKSNQIFIEKQQFDISPLSASIFKKINTQEELTNYLNELLIKIYQHLKIKDNNQVEKEFIYHLYTTIKRLSDILANLPQQPSSETWQTLFKKIVAQESVPFKGEPIQGLQILGILETRALDFENIVVIGLNEGTFPKTTPPNTLIPYNLRKGHGLPTIDNQDAIFAYYFYRLIHRAKNIKLLYTNTQSLTEEGEMSRFLQQLYYEYKGTVNMESILQKINTSLKPELTAKKSMEVMEIIDQWTSKGDSYLSPSALSMYLECPLRFYYRYIAGIKEPEQISEDLDPRVFGNLFHQIVELVYQPFTGKEVTPEDLKSLINNKELIRSVFDIVFIKNIPFIKQKTSLFHDLQGKNSLVYDILFKYILRFLDCELQDAPFFLTALEEKVKGQIGLNNGLNVNIGGTIDRVDIKDDILRITDYKTGKAIKEITDIENLFDEKKHSDQKAVFQTLLYALIKSESIKTKTIMPCVISIKDLYKEYDNKLYLKGKNHKEVITLEAVKESFTEHLNSVLTELFNPDIPFRQTSHQKSCEFCIFKSHCYKD